MGYPDSASPETEVVLRWLECEEGIQDQVADMLAAAVRAGDPADRRRVAAEALRRFVSERNPLKGEVSLYAELLALAFDRVDWAVLVEWLLPDDA